MVLNKTQWLTLAVAVCFAILQALQPFIHAHLDGDHPFQNTGFHVGDEHEEYVNVPEHSKDYTVSVVPHASHIVLVATGFKQDIDPALLIDAMAFTLLCLCLVIALSSSVVSYFPPLGLAPFQSLKRRLPAPRAPPQF